MPSIFVLLCLLTIAVVEAAAQGLAGVHNKSMLASDRIYMDVQSLLPQAAADVSVNYLDSGLERFAQIVGPLETVGMAGLHLLAGCRKLSRKTADSFTGLCEKDTLVNWFLIRPAQGTIELTSSIGVESRRKIVGYYFDDQTDRMFVLHASDS